MDNPALCITGPRSRPSSWLNFKAENNWRNGRLRLAIQRLSSFLVIVVVIVVASDARSCNQSINRLMILTNATMTQDALMHVMQSVVVSDCWTWHFDIFIFLRLFLSDYDYDYSLAVNLIALSHGDLVKRQKSPENEVVTVNSSYLTNLNPQL